MGKLGCFQKCCYNCWHILLGSGKEIAVIILFFFFFFLKRQFFIIKNIRKISSFYLFVHFFHWSKKDLFLFIFLCYLYSNGNLFLIFFNCSLFRWIKYCQYCKYIIVFSAMNWKAFSGCLEKKLNISSLFFFGLILIL